MTYGEHEVFDDDVLFSSDGIIYRNSITTLTHNTNEYFRHCEYFFKAANVQTHTNLTIFLNLYILSTM